MLDLAQACFAFLVLAPTLFVHTYHATVQRSRAEESKWAKFISCMQAKPCICSYMYMYEVYTPGAPSDGKSCPFPQFAGEAL
jgi:hypothetical protein